jgi:hypothetical protein
MSGYYGPGPQPGPGANGPGDGGPPSGNGARVFGFAAMAVLLVATVVSFAVTRSSGSSAKSLVVGVGVNPTERPNSITFPSTGGVTAEPAPTSATDSGGQGSASPVPPPTTRVRTTSIPAPATTHLAPPVQMSVYGVRNVVYKFFDGFLYHRLSDVRAAVCPKYRYLYNGTYTINPKGYEFQKWHSSSYTLYPGRTYVDIYVAVTLRNPATGTVGKTWNHTWVIILQNKTYYVCGTRT